jgi:hypothetical protein
LIKLINSNTDDDVKRISRQAFEKIRNKDWKAGINILSGLKGVGCATATSFFSIDKDNIPFMCDEVLEAITGDRDYKLPSYLVMRERLVSKAALVNMTASDLCQALWSHAILSDYDKSYNNILQNTGTKRSVDNDDGDNMNDEKTSKKKRKG